MSPTPATEKVKLDKEYHKEALFDIADKIWSRKRKRNQHKEINRAFSTAENSKVFALVKITVTYPDIGWGINMAQGPPNFLFFFP